MIPIRVKYVDTFSNPRTGYAEPKVVVTAAEAMCMETHQNGITWKYFHHGLGLRERFLTYEQIKFLAINDNLITTDCLDPINIKPYIDAANYPKTIEFIEDIYTISIDDGQSWFSPSEFDCTEQVQEAIRNNESLEFSFLIKTIDYMDLLDVKVYGCDRAIRPTESKDIKEVTLKNIRSNIVVEPVVTPHQFKVSYEIDDDLKCIPMVFNLTHFSSLNFAVEYKNDDVRLTACKIDTVNCKIELLSPTEFALHSATDDVKITIRK